jgi:cytochrome c553
MPPPTDPGLAGTASIAWRTISMPNGAMLMTHQRQVQSTLSESEGGYGGMCGDGPVEDALTMRNPDGSFKPLARLAHGSLPVDIAISAAGDEVAVVSAGSQTITVLPTTSVVQSEDDGGCEGGFPGGGGGADGGGVVPDIAGLPGAPIQDHLGIPTSVAFANSDVVVFYPEMPAIAVHFADTVHVIQLPADFGYDAGRTLFHQQTQVGIACASCHPEGHNDGLVWTFEEGVRRTQDLGGHVLQRAPFHWTGDMTDIPTLMQNVFAVRMAGGDPSDSAKQMLGPFLDRIPAPAAPPPLDPAAVARGETLFESQATGCTTCHNGALLSNKTIINVGTGQPFKVPSLIGVGGRAPFLHNGCAATLADRFGTCGGGDLHGKTSTLTAGDLSDLVAFLDSL